MTTADRLDRRRPRDAALRRAARRDLDRSVAFARTVRADSPTTRSSTSIPGRARRSRASSKSRCAVKEVLDEFGLHAVPKTSGASGIHIVLPLGPACRTTERGCSRRLSPHASPTHPKIATIERWVKSRASRRGVRRFSPEHSRKNRGRRLFRARATDGNRIDAAGVERDHGGSRSDRVHHR